MCIALTLGHFQHRLWQLQIIHNITPRLITDVDLSALKNVRHTAHMPRNYCYLNTHFHHPNTAVIDCLRLKRHKLVPK